ncbi:MAG: hypothetical protein P4M00_19400 [Azospirillaceae bacterium]|nr:hypothetical protein [Azospirillaceae bacterium]
MTSPVSVDALMAIAVGMEHEAALRYEQLATEMAARNEVELARTFRALAELERAHEAELSAWARRDGLSDPRPLLFTWRLPETFGTEDADGAPLSSYRILSLAVRNEEQAFAFYAYVAAQADSDREIRLRAEALAREELNHVARLRQARRHAYHAMTTQLRRGLPTARTLAELQRVATGLEQGSADVATATAASLATDKQPGTVLVGRAAASAAHGAETMARLSRFAEGDRPSASPAAESARSAGLLAAGRLTPAAALALCERDAEEVLEAYLMIAEQATEESLLHQAQALAEQAMSRLALVRSSKI